MERAAMKAKEIIRKIKLPSFALDEYCKINHDAVRKQLADTIAGGNASAYNAFRGGNAAQASHVTVYEAAAQPPIPVRRPVKHRIRFTAAEAPAFIGDRQVTAIVDTGSNSTIVPKHQVLSMGLWEHMTPASDVRINVASGVRAQPLGILPNLPITMYDTTIKVDAYVTDALSYDLLLGMDWLLPAECHINLQDRTLELPSRGQAGGKYVIPLGVGGGTVPATRFAEVHTDEEDSDAGEPDNPSWRSNNRPLTAEERLEHYLGTPTADGSSAGSSDDDNDGATDDDEEEDSDLPSLLNSDSDDHSDDDEEQGSPMDLDDLNLLMTTATVDWEMEHEDHEWQPCTANQGGAQQQYMIGQQGGAPTQPTLEHQGGARPPTGMSSMLITGPGQEHMPEGNNVLLDLTNLESWCHHVELVRPFAYFNPSHLNVFEDVHDGTRLVREDMLMDELLERSRFCEEARRVGQNAQLDVAIVLNEADPAYGALLSNAPAPPGLPSDISNEITEEGVDPLEARGAPLGATDWYELFKASDKSFDLSAHLSDTQRAEMLQVLESMKSVFSFHKKDFRADVDVAFRIETGDHKPIAQRACRASPKEKAAIDEEIDKLLELGLIRESSSPWASPVGMVPKKDGSWRIC